MEQSLKSVGNNIYDNKSRVSAAYSSNKIKENAVFRPHRKPITPFSSSVVNGYKGQSLNKIDSMKTNKKIDIIKLKCMQKPLTKPLQKNAMQTKWIEDQPMNISFDMQDQTDDAILQQSDSPQIYLRWSKFDGRPPTVHFRYPKCCGIQQQQDSKVFVLQKGNLYYKINGSEYKCIVNSLQFNGFQKCQYGSDWNIYFDIKGTKLKKIQHMSKHQKINHFPGCWYIGRKDFLWRGINKMRRSHPEAFNFVPMTYLLPSDYDRFEVAREKAEKNQLWILKPSAAACGRGIKMISKDTRLKNRKEYLISEYISNPHLINNLKYDLRIYILVTSYDPLRIYFFEEGLVRFATYEYNCKIKDIKKRYMHLTNFSVNKHSKRFVKNSKAQIDGQGSKWSLKALKKYYENNGIDVNQVFKRIEDVIIKTCISAEPNMLDLHSKSQEKRTCGFQIYGFDILIDSNLKPWLMEVNVCPSLSSSSPMDRKIKHTLLTDVLNLIGIQYHKDQDKLKKKLKENFHHMQTGRKIYSKNINTIEQLNFKNCIEMLSPEDWLILFESEEELDRLGHFKRIFPVSNNILSYEKLFEYKRYNNIILWKYLESNENFFDHLYKF